MEQNGGKETDGRKRVLVVGAGAAGMSTAYHLSQHPEKFDVTLIDAVDYCGGQAFSIPIDKERHGASWCNQGVQGGSYIFHHTLTMFQRQGFHADPVNLQVSFGKDETFWTNVFPTELLVRHQREVRRLVTMLKIIRLFEIFFALIPLKIVFKLFLFSDEFTHTVALPMTALFLGTGNATPDVPTIMFERLCTSPTYGMWYPPDKSRVVSNQPPMVVFPNLSEFYDTWRKDLVSRGVTVRLSTELTEVVQRSDRGVVVKLKPRTPAPDDGHNPNDADPDVPAGAEETYDELVLCCLADTAKTVLGRTATWRERTVLGAAKFSDDLTITHTDADYMKKHYENFYRPDLAVATPTDAAAAAAAAAAERGFRPMYYIKTYPGADRSKLEMSFDTTNYQAQFPARVPFERHVFQTIFLNAARDGALWTDGEIRAGAVVRRDRWHQLRHGWAHYARVVPWVALLLQGRRRTRFAGSWTLVNAHEAAVLSGVAAAVDLGAEYPADLEADRFALLCFRLYYLLAYGKWYRRGRGRGRAGGRSEARAAAAVVVQEDDGRSWATGPYGSVYKGPGVAARERQTWREEMEKGRSTDNLADGNAPGRSQP
ncbi:hypothetical protein F4809DRAFT_660166 [Biscogniauxia mediterranea]|nr:hypothetical protein F4809DRAFT_660166 [Biscogniauxia mediterranea]